VFAYPDHNTWWSFFLMTLLTVVQSPTPCCGLGKFARRQPLIPASSVGSPQSPFFLKKPCLHAILPLSGKLVLPLTFFRPFRQFFNPRDFMPVLPLDEVSFQTAGAAVPPGDKTDVSAFFLAPPLGSRFFPSEKLVFPLHASLLSRACTT